MDYEIVGKGLVRVRRGKHSEEHTKEDIEGRIGALRRELHSFETILGALREKEDESEETEEEKE